MRYISILLLSFSLITLNCFAKGYGDVICGSYPISIYDLDFTHNNFKVIFYYWGLSKTGYNAGKNMEISNATEYKLEFNEMDKVPGFDRSNVRYNASVIKNWDLTYFPFDRQILEVIMEDIVHEENGLKYIVDAKNSTIDPLFSIEGWSLDKFEMKTDTHIYTTNFGDESIKNSKFSRLKLIFHVKRFGGRLYASLFMGFFIAFLLCLIVYICTVDSVNFRSSIILGAIFSAIGNKYVIQQSIPPNTFVLLFDAIQIITFIIIFYTLLVIIATQRLAISGKKEKAIFFNQFSLLFTIVFYVIGVIVFTRIAFVS